MLLLVLFVLWPNASGQNISGTSLEDAKESLFKYHGAKNVGKNETNWRTSHYEVSSIFPPDMPDTSDVLFQAPLEAKKHRTPVFVGNQCHRDALSNHG
jgi:hypothetical protein